VSESLTVRIRADLPIRERRAIRARVRWLAHRSGRTEIEVLALTLYRVQATNRAGMVPQAISRIDALEHLLAAEIDMGGR